MTFQIPGIAELRKFRAEVDVAIDAVTKVLDFAEAHKTVVGFIPGVKGALPGLQALDDALKAAKALIDHV